MQSPNRSEEYNEKANVELDSSTTLHPDACKFATMRKLVEAQDGHPSRTTLTIELD